MCYSTKFGVAICQIVSVYAGVLKVLETLGPGWGVTCPAEISPPHMCHLAKFGRSVSNGTSVISVIRRENLTPFKVTQGYLNRHGSIGYL